MGEFLQIYEISERDSSLALSLIHICGVGGQRKSLAVFDGLHNYGAARDFFLFLSSGIVHCGKMCIRDRYWTICIPEEPENSQQF